MQIRPIVNSLQASLLANSSMASSDPAVEAAVNQLVDALGPALHVAAMEIAEQAAAEIRAQLAEQTVDVVLSDGDPTLRVGDAPRSAESRPTADELDARITLRLPPALKQQIEDSAKTAGDSVNAWVVEALGKRAGRSRLRGKQYTESFDL